MRVSLCRRSRFVGLHRAVEGEEIRIAAERLGEDAVALGVALAADLLGLRRWRRPPARSRRDRRARGFPARAGCPGRGTRPPRADARSACADRPPGCSARAGRRGGCARRRRRCRRPAPRGRAARARAPSACARSSRTTWISVASPSTRRSAELSSVDEPRIGALDRADRLIELQRVDRCGSARRHRPRAASGRRRSLPAPDSRDRGCACRCEMTLSISGILKFSPGSVTTRTGWPSRTTSACRVW